MTQTRIPQTSVHSTAVAKPVQGPAQKMQVEAAAKSLQSTVDEIKSRATRQWDPEHEIAQVGVKGTAVNVVISPSSYSQDEIRTAVLGHLEKAGFKDVPLAFEQAPKLGLPEGNIYDRTVQARPLGARMPDSFQE